MGMVNSNKNTVELSNERNSQIRGTHKSEELSNQDTLVH